MKLKRPYHKNDDVIELKEIGQITQSLLGSNFQHRFLTETKFSIDQNETKKILKETDDTGNVFYNF